MTGGDWGRLTVPMVIEAAQKDDAVALETFDQVGHFLGIGIASLVNALNPDLVVFGGILSLAGDFFLPIVKDELNRRALRWNAEATEVWAGGPTPRKEGCARLVNGKKSVPKRIISNASNIAFSGGNSDVEEIR